MNATDIFKNINIYFANDSDCDWFIACVLFAFMLFHLISPSSSTRSNFVNVIPFAVCPNQQWNSLYWLFWMVNVVRYFNWLCIRTRWSGLINSIHSEPTVLNSHRQSQSPIISSIFGSLFKVKKNYDLFNSNNNRKKIVINLVFFAIFLTSACAHIHTHTHSAYTLAFT